MKMGPTILVKHIVGLFLFVSFLTGCSTLDVDQRRKDADQIAKENSFEKIEITTKSFTLTAFKRLNSESNPLVVYVGGDGFAFRTPSLPSRNPTPRDHLELKLAALDPSVNVVYLARPCQYTKFGQKDLCQREYWTLKRYGEKVVKSIDQAIDQLKMTKDQKVQLVGYSGGATISLLLSSRRRDIQSIRSIAGNLDQVKLMKYHQVVPLKGSLDPMKEVEHFKNIPQIHFVGEDDNVVPPWLSEQFKKDVPSSCVSRQIIPDVDHQDGWTEAWSQLVIKTPRCLDP